MQIMMLRLKFLKAWWSSGQRFLLSQKICSSPFVEFHLLGMARKSLSTKARDEPVGCKCMLSMVGWIIRKTGLYGGHEKLQPEKKECVDTNICVGDFCSCDTKTPVKPVELI